jgi:hypothetical protein
VNYINAYGCDAVPSEYVVISRNDTRPRSVDVVSGRMYLYLCDSPAAHPYLSSLIFTSFVVLTGFMLISLTVAAVSGGVHLRLEQIQKQRYDEDEDEDEFDDDIESLSEVGNVEDSHVAAAAEAVRKEEIEKEVRRTMRTHTFYGNGTPPPVQFKPKAAPQSVASPTPPSQDATEAPQISRMASFVEEDSEEESDGSDSATQAGAEKKSEIGTKSEVREIQPQHSQEDLSSDTDDAVTIRPVSLASARLTLANLEKASSAELGASAGAPHEDTQESPDSGASPLPLKAATHASRKTFRSNGVLRRNSSAKLPLLQDKETIRMMLKQMWADVEKEKEKRLEEETAGGGDGSEEKQTNGSSPNSSSTNLSARETVRRMSISPSTTPRMNQSTVLPSNAQSFRTQLQRHSSFRQETDTASLSSKYIAYVLRNILSTYFYIGYIILIVLVTASVEIFCTNKDNCQNFRPLFVAVQILLSLDIVVRVLTEYPTYKTFFMSRRNLFDLGMVLIIWIPIFYHGYGAQIAGESSSSTLLCPAAHSLLSSPQRVPGSSICFACCPCSLGSQTSRSSCSRSSRRPARCSMWWA